MSLTNDVTVTETLETPLDKAKRRIQHLQMGVGLNYFYNSWHPGAEPLKVPNNSEMQQRIWEIVTEEGVRKEYLDHLRKVEEHLRNQLTNHQADITVFESLDDSS